MPREIARPASARSWRAASFQSLAHNRPGEAVAELIELIRAARNIGENRHVLCWLSPNLLIDQVKHAVDHARAAIGRDLQFALGHRRR